MGLKVNDIAPLFTLPSTSGANFSLDIDALNKPLILYFYPKDFTSVCTSEACEFRDYFSFFRNLDIEVYGISKDNIESHNKFRIANQLPFHLLSDEKGEVSEKYKAVIPIIKLTKRITYLLDKNHQIVGVFENLFSASKHIKAMVERVNNVKL